MENIPTVVAPTHEYMRWFFFFDRNFSRSQSFYAERSYVPRKTCYWVCLRVACRMLICLYIRLCGVVISRFWSKYFRIVYKGQQAIIDYKQISSQSLKIFCLLLTKENSPTSKCFRSLRSSEARGKFNIGINE